MLFGNDLKALSCGGKDGLLASELLEAAHDLVPVGRIELDEPRAATALVCRDQRAARAGERILGSTFRGPGLNAP